MRNDLTQAFIAKMQSEFRKPIQLIVFHFAFGDIYLSDRDITIAPNSYTGLIEDWGQINTSAFDTSDIISETLEITITLWNGGEQPFSNYFLLEDPVDIEVDIYQTFDGLVDEDKALIGNFVIQDPISYSENSRLLSLDLVSLNMRYTANIGSVLTKSNWPNALEADLNKGIDLIVGDAGKVKCLTAKTPKIVTMKGSILKLPTIVNVHENLDELDFSEIGYIVIDDEILHYNLRDSDTFNIDKRGQLGTLASEHSDGSTILEYITDHTYTIGQGPLTSISEVKAGDLPVDKSDYTTDLLSNPATITFPIQPSFVKYGNRAQTEIIDFDTTTENSSAYRAFDSYNPDDKSIGAIISSFGIARPGFPNSPLAIKRSIQIEDKGEIVRVFLSVEHWSTDAYLNDYIEVWIDGIGIIGQLPRPNEKDIAFFQGDVDLDHEHKHKTGGIHDHGFTNPSLITDNPQHKHGTSISGPTYTDGGDEGLPTFKGTYSAARYFSVSYIWRDNPTSKTIRVRFRNTGGGVVQLRDSTYSGAYIEWSGSARSVDQIVTVNLDEQTLTLYCGKGGVVGGGVEIYEMTMTTIVEGGIDFIQTGVNARHYSTGDVANKGIDTTGTSIKDSNDVDDFYGANRILQNIESRKATKTITNRYDLTKYKEDINWNWLIDREVQLRHVGDNDLVSVIIPYINFEVEYNKRERFITNDITCKPIGSIENRPDAVIQYVLNSIAGIPLELMGSIWAQPQTWDDGDIWDDSDIWLDGGEKLPAPEGAAFEEAASRYQFLGYKLDGIIPANKTVQDTIKDICKQARGRILWSAGQVKLAVRERIENWITLKQLGKDEVRLRSIAVEKEQIDRVYNDIDLFYNIDRTSDAIDEGIYNSSVSLIDNASITKHGQKKDNSNWLFDLVRSDSMANDLIDYYLWRHGEPITKYSFVSYLQQFDIEKDDIIRITSDFSRLISLPLRISNNTRIFGSGKINKINTINLIGESIRHKLHIINIEDSIIVLDSIDVGLGDDHDTVDSINISEEINFIQGKELNDSIATSDEIKITSEFNSSFNETINISDELEFDFNLVLEDSIILTESINVSYEPCFGACGFGELPFGSPTFLNQGNEDSTNVIDEAIITMQYNLELEDSVIITDDLIVFNNLEDNIGFEEELIFNSCFGCPIVGATGFGLNNFGR